MAGREKAVTKKENPAVAEKVKALEGTIDNLVKERDRIRADISKTVSENESLKKTVKALNGEIASLKTAMDKSEIREGSDEYVEIVAIPPVHRMQMAPIIVNGASVPPTIDEDGFDHFVVPRKTAIGLIAHYGARHVLVGPVDYIDCSVPGPKYENKVRCLKHRKTKEGSTVSWVPVVVEEAPAGG